MSRKTVLQSGVLLLGLFIVLIAVGSAIASGPSEEVIASDRRPTTTTTTEPPPEGVAFVVINNGAFRPAILDIDVNEIQTVRWSNEDESVYLFTSTADLWEPVELAQGDEFEFDFSTVEPGIYRFNATLGFNRIPGSVDTRPEQ